MSFSNLLLTSIIRSSALLQRPARLALVPTSFHFLELYRFSEFQGRIKIRRKTKTDIDLCDAWFFHTW